jgi:transposase
MSVPKNQTTAYAAYQARRAQVIEMVSCGATYHEASNAYGVAVETVRGWCQTAGVVLTKDARSRSRRGHVRTPDDRIRDLYRRRTTEFGGDVGDRSVAALVARELDLTEREVMEAVR